MKLVRIGEHLINVDKIRYIKLSDTRVTVYYDETDSQSFYVEEFDQAFRAAGLGAIIAKEPSAKPCSAEGTGCNTRAVALQYIRVALGSTILRFKERYGELSDEEKLAIKNIRDLRVGD